MLIGTWNTQGIRNKTGEIVHSLQNTKQDIVILTETKKKGNGVEMLGPFLHFYSGVPKEKRAKRGISILIKKKYKRNITSWEAIDENIIKLNINLFGRNMVILGIYNISNDENRIKKDEMFTKINGILSEIGISREIIIAGDFNASIGKKINSTVVGPFGEDNINDNGERLIDICEQNSLKILNGFFQHKEIHKYTWHKDSLQLQ